MQLKLTAALFAALAISAPIDCTEDADVYEYIVVGSGPGGGSLA